MREHLPHPEKLELAGAAYQRYLTGEISWREFQYELTKLRVDADDRDSFVRSRPSDSVRHTSPHGRPHATAQDKARFDASVDWLVSYRAKHKAGKGHPDGT